MTEPKKRGFAALTPERRREISAMGGRSVPSQFRGFSRDPALARRAAKASAAARKRNRDDEDARVALVLDAVFGVP